MLQSKRNHTVACAVKRAGIVDDIGGWTADHSAIIGAAGAILRSRT
jgi:hypothetical protein